MVCDIFDHASGRRPSLHRLSGQPENTRGIKLDRIESRHVVSGAQKYPPLRIWVEISDTSLLLEKMHFTCVSSIAEIVLCQIVQ